MHALFLLLFFLPVAGRAAADLPWKVVQGVVWVELEALSEAFPIKIWRQPGKKKVLLEHSVSKRTALLLEGSPYLVANGIFLAVPEPLESHRGKPRISSGALRQLGRHLLSQREMDTLEESIERVSGEVDAGVCMLQRPVEKVMLDPGHGGDDHGAKRGGIREKDVVLRFGGIL
ncbi:MAG: N-acetylmuramoyl-L-alanine amidase, partial [Bdellovibrionales bacterium]|nr:N-acetylmuramoyl-L-alanine amidase [Bdellovibrionales bacterium]